MRIKCFQKLAIIFITVIMLMPFGASVSAAEKSVRAGEVWKVSHTTHLTGLTIAEHATITAPEDCSVTMTVDNVETAIKPGMYRGDIVLTVTKEISIQYANLNDPHLFRTAVYVENGKYVADKSVEAAVAEGTVTDTSARDVRITSIGENFNGIIVTGDSKFSIRSPKISFTGNGGNDFAGFGAAVMSDGNADVIVDDAEITTRGAVRTAVWVGGDSTMTVNNSNIEVYEGVLPEDYEFSIQAGTMKEVPWMLGITGNCRATNVVDGGAAYYNNSRIKAQAWGALSTDGAKNGKLHATKCIIETVESGYGAYADGAVLDIFSGCEFNVTDYGLIMTGGEGIFTDGTVVNSGRFGVMFHGSANLTIDKGSVFNTKQEVIQIKSAFPEIVVDNATLNSESGIILQTMINDDPFKSGGGMPPGGMPPEGMPEGGMPVGMPGGDNGRSDVAATFKNVVLNGDIVTSMTTLGDVNVNFENSVLTGAITTASAKARSDIDGVKLDRETCSYIGAVKNTYCATGDPYGLRLSLDKNSRWIVDKTSYLTGLTIAEGAAIAPPNGSTLVMTVDGIETIVKPGTYTGVIAVNINVK